MNKETINVMVDEVGYNATAFMGVSKEVALKELSAMPAAPKERAENWAEETYEAIKKGHDSQIEARNVVAEQQKQARQAREALNK